MWKRSRARAHQRLGERHKAGQVARLRSKERFEEAVAAMVPAKAGETGPYLVQAVLSEGAEVPVRHLCVPAAEDVLLIQRVEVVEESAGCNKGRKSIQNIERCGYGEFVEDSPGI